MIEVPLNPMKQQVDCCHQAAPFIVVPLAKRDQVTNIYVILRNRQQAADLHLPAAHRPWPRKTRSVLVGPPGISVLAWRVVVGGERRTREPVCSRAVGKGVKRVLPTGVPVSRGNVA